MTMKRPQKHEIAKFKQLTQKHVMSNESSIPTGFVWDVSWDGWYQSLGCECPSERRTRLKRNRARIARKSRK